jgi:hypothetical protein
VAVDPVTVMVEVDVSVAVAAATLSVVEATLNRKTVEKGVTVVPKTIPLRDMVTVPGAI